LKPSSDLILVDGDIGKMDSAIKVADAAIKHFDCTDLSVSPGRGIDGAKNDLRMSSSFRIKMHL
jgi:hypothetical protein